MSLPETSLMTSSTAAVLDIAVLVFREGLECVLVLAAITTGGSGLMRTARRPIAAGVGVGFLATLATWFIAVGAVNDLSGSVSALALQAATGLLAILVLLVVMNWFFHRLYWTGWISLHSRQRNRLLNGSEGDAAAEGKFARRAWLGLALLGFTSLYREGFEVVLFLQSYRLRVGGRVVLEGAWIGVVLAGAVALLTFAAHKRLPYKKMLVATGMLLGIVLLVMVGEQAQEMQLAHWLPTTTIPALVPWMPDWAGLWFSLFPTVETLAAQGIAAMLVLGSYWYASTPRPSRKAAAPTKPQTVPRKPAAAVATAPSAAASQSEPWPPEPPAILLKSSAGRGATAPPPRL